MSTSKAKSRRTAGFTLVELIVVIAILGILAGVGTVAYTGYVNYTKKGVDKQLVGELIYATQLADYANPGLIKEGGTGAMIVVSEKGTDAAGGTNTEQLKKALEDSMGNLSEVKLAYTEWAGSIDGATLKSMKDSLAEDQIGYMDSTGNVLFKDENGNDATIGYAANADALWEAVEAAAGFAAATGDGEAGEYLAKMAQYTVGDETVNGASMGESWSSSDTLTNNSSGNMDVMISSGGMAIARNFAFAEYLKSNDIEVSDNALQILQATPTGIDMNDWLSDILRGKDQAKTRFGTDFDALQGAANAYMTGVYSKEGGVGQYSQAYLDGMIYYALMHNVNEVSTNGTYEPTSKTYLTDIGGYVSLAGSVFSGNTDMASMVELADSLSESDAQTTVVITVTKKNGVLNFKVKPDDADPRDGSGSNGSGTTTPEETAPTEETSSASITISEDGTATISPNVIARKTTNTQTLQIMKSRNTLQIPDGWSMTSIAVTLTTANGTYSAESTTAVAIATGDNFSVSVNAKSPLVLLKAYDAESNTSASVNITFNMTDSSGNTRSATLSTTLWAID